MLTNARAKVIDLCNTLVRPNGEFADYHGTLQRLMAVETGESNDTEAAQVVRLTVIANLAICNLRNHRLHCELNERAIDHDTLDEALTLVSACLDRALWLTSFAPADECEPFYPAEMAKPVHLAKPNKR